MNQTRRIQADLALAHPRAAGPPVSDPSTRCPAGPRRAGSRGFPGARAAACLALAAAAALGAASQAAAQSEPAPRVEVVIVGVRAAGSPEAGRSPDVDAELKDLGVPWAKLGFAKYLHAKTVERRVAWESAVELTFAETGRYSVTARPGTEARPVTLSVVQTMPGAEEACLVLDVDVAPGQRQLLFCNERLGRDTHLFIVSARPAAD